MKILENVVYINNFPPKDPNFVGRHESLKKIKEYFDSGVADVVITGNGGSGKTALATAFINNYLSGFKHIIWINACTGILENLSKDLRLKQYFSIENKYTTTSEISHRIIDKLNKIEGNNLLILDDVAEDFQQLRKITPLQNHWKILATSRLVFKDFRSVTIEKLSENYALELFYKHYLLQKNDQLVLEILSPFSFQPILIKLLAISAQFNKCKLNKLLKQLKAIDTDSAADLSKIHDYKNLTVNNLVNYYDNLFPLNNYPIAELNILRQFSIFPGGYFEIEDLIKLFLTDKKRLTSFKFSLGQLVKKGWIENFNLSYSLNKTLKEFIAVKYPHNFEFYLPQVINIIKLLSVDKQKESPKVAIQWLTFGQELVNLFDLTHDEMVSLANNLALRYRDNGNLETSRVILEKVLEADLKKYGSDNKIVELSMANLGNLYADLGDYQKAAELLEKSLQSTIKSYPENHPKVAIRYSNLGMVYRDMGKFSEAKKLLKSALNIDLKLYPEDHPQVAIRQSNLAMVCNDLGDYKTAYDLLIVSIKTTIVNYGANHPQVALRYAYIAKVYKAMGHYKPAIDYLKKALEIDVQNFGETHHRIAINWMKLATMYLEINDLDRAITAIKRSLFIAMDSMGAEHPDTIAIKKMYLKIMTDKG
ncbi:MAG: tetratricopeptide repeat protein [Bacteroidales bacterium]|nr:tetratricopeptide repeat protein [Bacteroidales bacterium]